MKKKQYKKPSLKKFNSLREITLCTCGTPDSYCTCLEYKQADYDPKPWGPCTCAYAPDWKCD
jgi:hypothetical protein